MTSTCMGFRHLGPLYRSQRPPPKKKPEIHPRCFWPGTFRPMSAARIGAVKVYLKNYC